MLLLVRQRIANVSITYLGNNIYKGILPNI